MHARIRQDCFILPAPPNFFISLQVRHSPQSSRRQFSHCPHRVRRRLIPGPTFVPTIGPLGPCFLAAGFFYDIKKRENSPYYPCCEAQSNSPLHKLLGEWVSAFWDRFYQNELPLVEGCVWKILTNHSSFIKFWLYNARSDWLCSRFARGYEKRLWRTTIFCWLYFFKEIEKDRFLFT